MKQYWGVCSCCGKIKPVGEYQSYQEAWEMYVKACTLAGLKVIWLFEGLPVILGKDSKEFAVVSEPVVIQLSNGNWNVSGPPEVEIRIIDFDAVEKATYQYRSHPTIKEYVAEHN